LAKKRLMMFLLLVIIVTSPLLYYLKFIEFYLMIFSIVGSIFMFLLNLYEFKEVKKKEIERLLGEAGDLYSGNQLANAIKKFEIVLKAQPDNYDAHIGMAQCKRMKLDMEGALENCRKAIEINSEKYQAYYFLGMIHLQENRLEEAYNSFRVVEKRKPKFEDIYYLIAEINEKLEDFDTAKKYYERYLDICRECKMKEAVIGRLQILSRQDLSEIEEIQTPVEQTPSEADQEKETEPETIVLADIERAKKSIKEKLENKNTDKEKGKAPKKGEDGAKICAQLMGLEPRDKQIMLEVEMKVSSKRKKRKRKKLKSAPSDNVPLRKKNSAAKSEKAKLFDTGDLEKVKQLLKDKRKEKTANSKNK